MKVLKAIGGLLVVVLVFALIAFAYVHNAAGCGLCAGFAFLIAGLLFFVSEKEKKFLCLAPAFIGLIIIILVVWSYWGEALGIPQSFPMLPVMGIFVFGLIGVTILVSMIIKYHHNKTYCTEPVSAMCKSYFYSIRRMGTPTFHYIYNDVSYEVVYYSRFVNNYEVGDPVYLYINPQNPEEVYLPSFKQSFYLAVIGILFILAAIGITIGLIYIYCETAY